MTKKMYPPGTTDGTIQRLEAKIKRLELVVTKLRAEADFARSAGKMEGIRMGLKR